MTFFYKYVFAPIWGGMFLIVIIFTWNMEEKFLHDWSRAAALMAGWASIWLIILMVRLKSVEATREYLIIKNAGEQKLISYRDIEYVSQIAMINPILISIKYRDNETGQSNKILVMPSMVSQIFRFNFFEEIEMTKFIRERIMESNSNYNSNLEPSRWFAFGLIMLTGIPVGLIVKTFFMHFDH